MLLPPGPSFHSTSVGATCGYSGATLTTHSKTLPLKGEATAAESPGATSSSGPSIKSVKLSCSPSTGTMRTWGVGAMVISLLTARVRACEAAWE